MMLETVGQYRILRKLGEGGMGVVYAAHDERLDRQVAIKMIRDSSADPVARERLWREARAAASTNHPNVCQLFEIGESAGELYIAMELLEGESLAARLSRGPLPVADAARTALTILSVLAALHRRGLIHRDLKPSNVFMTPVGVKLLDFGLARPITGAFDATRPDLTVAGTLVGTPQYLAPEALFGRPLDARADLFAVGVILYELLAGRPPFAGSTVVQVLHAVMYEQPPALGGSPVIGATDRVIRRALAKQPDHRYQTAEAMADDLRGALAFIDSGDTTSARAMTRLIVLPLRILRSDPETDFLAFSLPDAITTSLSGLESLVVRSSLTAARFAGETPDLEAIVRDADVDAVLTGTQLRAGDRIRLNTQLVEAPGGTVLWSQASEAPLGDIFRLQDDLVQRIVSALAVPLTTRDHRTLRRDVPASARAYELYLRANQLSTQARDWVVARDLYLECLADDPDYAPAWARLGRIYRVLGAYGAAEDDENLERAQQAFRRALELNPDLTLAHNLATHLEVEVGQGQAAMLRLIDQARQRAGDAELFAGLVQACRYCGLLEASVAAHEQARRLDPHIRTSVSHAYLMLGDYQAAIDATVDDPPIPALLALSLMGRDDEALALLKKLEAQQWPRAIHLFLRATRLLLEGLTTEALETTSDLVDAWSLRDPCGRYYLARQLARLGDSRAQEHFRRSVEGGFVCWSFFTRDPWLDGLRTHPEFRSALRLAETRHRDALAAFLQAEGDRVLGARVLPG